MTSSQTPISALKDCGPLAHWAGVWEGDQGHDIAPSPQRSSQDTRFKERTEFMPINPVFNHEQCLHGFRFMTTAWKLDGSEAFHEETGYWLWDAAKQQVKKCFAIPRGISLMAGGTVAPDATHFSLSASSGSCTYGINSNQFLEDEFKILRYDVSLKMLDDHTLSYESTTQIQIVGMPAVFHHIDKNILTRVKH